MRKINNEIRQRLVEQWLVPLRKLKEDRRPMQRLMCVVLLVPLILMVVLVAHMLIVENFHWVEGAITTSLLGVSALCFVYLGRIQACNDDLILIELAVIKGDEELLYKAISKISCFGSFREILSDVKLIVADGNATPTTGVD